MSSRGVNALAARVAHAAVEGTAFVWTKDGALILSSKLRADAVGRSLDAAKNRSTRTRC